MIVLRGFLRGVDWLNTQFGKFGSWLVIVMMLVVTYDVICRYVFNNPNIWAYDVEIQLWSFHFIAVAAWVELSGGNVSMDVFSKRWSRKTRAWIDVLLYMCVAMAFFGIATWAGTNLASQSWQFKEEALTSWAPPIYPIRTTVPVFCGLLSLQILARIIRLWHYIITDKAEGVWAYL